MTQKFAEGDRLRFEAEGVVTNVAGDIIEVKWDGTTQHNRFFEPYAVSLLTKITPPRKTGTEQYQELAPGTKFEFVQNGRALGPKITRIKINDQYYARFLPNADKPDVAAVWAEHDGYDINPR